MMIYMFSLGALAVITFLIQVRHYRHSHFEIQMDFPMSLNPEAGI